MSKKRKRNKIFFLLLVFIIAALVSVACFLLARNWLKTDDSNTATIEDSTDTFETEDDEIIIQPEISKVDFQPVIDEWVASLGGNKSVLIYDLDRAEMVGSYNPNEDYNTASLYKLFVVYEGYRRLQSGEWQADNKAGVTGYTILECLDLAIRQSYSQCAETLFEYIGYDNLDEIIKTDFKITNSDISSLLSNPEDIFKIMLVFYNHFEITNEDLLARMKDSFLNQPITEYNWRQGLPSGFSDAVKVYDKVGWDWNGVSWNAYHDAAIIDFPDLNRHFIVVVMTNQVPFQKISELGSKIESKLRSV